MSKSAKKRPTAPLVTPVSATKPSQQVVRNHKSKKADTGSKQSRVIAMLQSPKGATIAAMMMATGWQPHSVRAFLAGVVRKRLKLKVNSKKVDNNRVYEIACGVSGKDGPRQPKHRSA